MDKSWVEKQKKEEENKLNRYNGLYNNKELLMKRWNSLLDSEPKFFSGDIIITDPCYIMKENDDIINSDYPDVRKYLKYDFQMTNYMIRDTLYGDWSCTTYNSDTKEPIGSFCADGGLVGVFLLDEVLKYNPEFDNHIKCPWTTTLIKNFEGTVQFIVSQGEKEDDFNVSVIGHGINKKTGKPLNFFTTQTGL